MKPETCTLAFFGVLMALATVNAQNLVPNGSFEDYTSCPGSYSRIKEEFRIRDWYSANAGTPDAFNVCGQGDGGVPYNWAGVSEAWEGKGYAGIYLWHKFRDFREYIQCRLTTELVKDTTYFLSFRYRLSSYSRFVADRIGMHLSDSAVRVKHDRPWMIDPALTVISDSVLTPKTGLWEYAAAEYKARGGERYITIGNFAGDETTKTYEIMHRPAQQEMLRDAAYYYVDDVVVRMKFDPTVPQIPLATFSNTEVRLDERYILDHILFEFNRYKLLPRSFDQLEEVVQVLQKHREYRVRLAGHTDDVGSDESNLRLSERRAHAVALYLIQRGIAKERIDSIGFGKRSPLLAGSGEEVRKVNRRVEITFFR